MIDTSTLKSFDILRRMSSSMVKGLAGQAEERTYQPGEAALEQGQPAETLFGLVEGEAELRFLFRDRILKLDVSYEESIQRSWETVDTPIILETFRPGALFGWSSMVGRTEYTASVVCTAPTRVWAVKAQDLRTLLDSEPTMGYVFMDYLAGLIAGRLAWRTDKLVQSWAEAFGSGRVE